MKTKKIIQFTFCFLMVLQSSGQMTSLTKKEIYQLQYSFITDFIRNHETKMENRKSEFILIFLETDSTSKVNKIRLLADEKNRDSVYSILSRMTPDDFKDWKPKECKNKIIVVPLFGGGIDWGNYVDIFWQDYVFNKARGNKFLAEENKRVIVLNALLYSPPISISDIRYKGTFIKERDISNEKKNQRRHQ